MIFLTLILAGSDLPGLGVPDLVHDPGHIATSQVFLGKRAARSPSEAETEEAGHRTTRYLKVSQN